MSSRSVRLAILIGPLIVGLAACDGATGPGLELALARARWAQRGPPSYTITVARLCECLETGPVEVTVQNGVIESRTLTRNGAPVPSSYAALFPSVDGLFERIDSAQRTRVARLDVTFDPTYGYPTRIEIDHFRPTVDDEVTFVATNLEVR